jgi:hypothetical protein
MKGCSKKNKSIRSKKITRLGKNKNCNCSHPCSGMCGLKCKMCPPDCRCGPNNCNCSHNCPKTCYLKCNKCPDYCNCGPLNKAKGGSGCGSNGCPIAPLSWNKMNQLGGNCGSCNSGLIMPNSSQGILGVGQNGGSNFYKPASPIAGPFEGQPWGAKVIEWPGVDGIGGNRNYLANNLYNHGDPQTMMQLGGRKKKSRQQKKSAGGGIFPQDLVNLGSDFSYNFQSAYNSLNGYNAPVDPLPYKGQLPNNRNFAL